MYLNFQINANTACTGIAANTLLLANGSVGLPGQFLSTGADIGDNDYWVTLPIPDVSKLTSNNTLYVGAVLASDVVSSTQLQANLAAITLSLSDLSTYQTVAGLAANVATLQANAANYIGSLAAIDVVSNTQLNNALAGVSPVGYQTEAGLSANVAKLTSNNSNYLGGLAAAEIATTTQLQANISSVTALIPSINGLATTDQLSANINTVIAAIPSIAGLVTTAQLTANVNAITATIPSIAGLANTAQLNANIASVTALIPSIAGLATTAQLNANIAGLTFVTPTQLTANLAGLTYVTPSQLTANLSTISATIPSIVGLQTTAGLAANVATLPANSASFIGTLPASNVVSNTYLQTALSGVTSGGGQTLQPAIMPSDLVSTASQTLSTNYVMGTLYFIKANTILPSLKLATKGVAASAKITPAIYSDVGGVCTALLAAGPQVTGLTAGINTFPLTTNWTCPADGWYWLGIGITGTTGISMYQSLTATFFYYVRSDGVPQDPAPACTYGVGGNNAHIWAIPLGSDVATMTANNTLFVGTVSAANVVSNAQLSANISTVTALIPSIVGLATTASIPGIISTNTSNNASYFGTQLPAYYTNATNITTGTIPYAQLGAAVVNTSGNFSLSGVITHTGNVALQTLLANGVVGTAGQILTTSGTSGNAYWANAAAGSSNALFTYFANTGNTGVYASPITLLSAELVSLPTSYANTSARTFSITDTGGAIMGELFFSFGNPGVSSLLSSTAQMTGWFLPSYDGVNFENSIITISVRPPDFVIPFPASTIAAGAPPFKSIGTVTIPSMVFKVVVFNSIGQTIGNGGTTAPSLKLIPIAIKEA